MKDGPMKPNVHLCYKVTGGLLPPCPLSVWWILHFSPKHHPFLSNWSLNWPFPPVITPTSSSLLSHKAELPVDHELI